MFFSLILQERTVLTDLPNPRAAALEYDMEQVYVQTRAQLCSYLLSLGVPSAQAQEVTQEVYLRLFRTMRKGEKIENLRAWLFRVAYNLGLKVRAREKTFRAVSPDWDRFTDLSGESAERVMLDREKTERLEAALQTLSPQQRNCIYLRAEGLRYREIAEIMGIGIPTVNEFLRRAVSRLAEAIRG